MPDPDPINLSRVFSKTPFSDEAGMTPRESYPVRQVEGTVGGHINFQVDQPVSPPDPIVKPSASSAGTGMIKTQGVTIGAGGLPAVATFNINGSITV